MVKSKVKNLQLVKDIFHFIFPIALLFTLPQGWTTLMIVFSYFVVKSYVYIFIKKQDELTDIATIGLILQAFILTGYVEAL